MEQLHVLFAMIQQWSGVVYINIFHCKNEMNFLQLFFFLFISNSPATALAAPGPEKRIVNGSPADLFSHPHQASVQVHGGRFRPPLWYHTCGGVLIATTKVRSGYWRMMIRCRVEDVG